MCRNENGPARVVILAGAVSGRAHKRTTIHQSVHSCRSRSRAWRSLLLHFDGHGHENTETGNARSCPLNISQVIMPTANSSASKEVATAALLVIGSKILSGRTKDQNIGYVAEYLTAVGIDLKEVRVVGDEERAIVVTDGLR